MLLNILLLVLLSCTQSPVKKVEKIGPLVQAFDNTGKVIGQDAAYSVPIGDKSLWLFGDTFFGVRKNGESDYLGAVHNSAALSDHKDIENLQPHLKYFSNQQGFATYYLKNQGNEDSQELKLWPNAGINIGGQTYIYYSLVAVTGTGSWDFKHQGQGIAQIKDINEAPVRLKNRGSFKFWQANEPRFGVATIEYEGWVYVFGRSEQYPYEGYLARVKPNQLARRSAYYYYQRSNHKISWTKQLAQATPLFEYAPPEASLSYNSHLNKFLLIYSRTPKNEVAMRTADNMDGLWSKPISVLSCKPRKAKAFCYAAKEHPQFHKQSGKVIYFTMVDSSCMFCALPDVYRVEFE